MQTSRVNKSGCQINTITLVFIDHIWTLTYTLLEQTWTLLYLFILVSYRNGKTKVLYPKLLLYKRRYGSIHLHTHPVSDMFTEWFSFIILLIFSLLPSSTFLLHHILRTWKSHWRQKSFRKRSMTSVTLMLTFR